MASIMFVNNEIGVIQPIKEIGEICKKHKIFFHTDAAQVRSWALMNLPCSPADGWCNLWVVVSLQATGKIRFDVNDCNIDLMSISGHKIYGPKGIGAIYVRRKPRRVRLEAIISGGGQVCLFPSRTMSPHRPSLVCFLFPKVSSWVGVLVNS